MTTKECPKCHKGAMRIVEDFASPEKLQPTSYHYECTDCEHSMTIEEWSNLTSKWMFGHSTNADMRAVARDKSLHAKKQGEEILMSAPEWAALDHIEICDNDGFTDIDAPITFEEYEKGIIYCTCRWNLGKAVEDMRKENVTPSKKPSELFLDEQKLNVYHQSIMKDYARLRVREERERIKDILSSSEFIVDYLSALTSAFDKLLDDHKAQEEFEEDNYV